MNAFGKYIDFARHLQSVKSVKNGEATGDIGDVARETVALDREYRAALNEYLGHEPYDDFE